MSTYDRYILKYCKVAKKGQYISCFPDSRAVANCAENYNVEYGLDTPYYPDPYTNHKGTDWLFPSGTALYGLKGFTVNAINPINANHGNHIEIGNPHIAFILSHLSSINVSVGQSIDENTIIAYTGNTGYSQGPHLHIQCWLAGTEWVDATPYMDGSEAIPGIEDDVEGKPLAEGSVALWTENNELVNVYENAVDNGQWVTRIYRRDGSTAVIESTKLQQWNNVPIGYIGAFDGDVNNLVQVIEYGLDKKNLIVRVRFEDKTEAVVFACRVYGFPIFENGTIATLKDFGDVRIDDRAYDNNGDLVYRISTVVYGTRVKPKE